MFAALYYLTLVLPELVSLLKHKYE